MPLVGADALVELVDAYEQASDRAARRIADAGVDRLERNVRRRTPIDTNPFRNRPERPRGALKRSVHRLEGLRRVVSGGRPSYSQDVVSYDPVADYVEFDTPPHVIRPRIAGGYLHFQSRDGFTGRDGVYYPPGTWVTVAEVHHPGTKGQHMFSLGALDTEAELPDFARGPLAQWKREVESVHV